ncbi:MAG: alcohol dehydrogenase catalytic domain-containing protein [Candidatus Kariarchaeaceae archaeon]|jgi:6-hydroxycyclohex-1-ene-1-carbonyl-CoA dehydrogenase
MKAAIFDGSHTLKIEEIDKPEPSDTEILVKVVACGVCHTDEGYIEGTPTFKQKPLILGHEASGLVEVVGKNVSGFEVGDPVLIPPVLTCGTCEYCLAGRETICSRQQMLGNHIDGAFAEYIAVKAKDVVKVPEGLSLADVSIVADAVATPYHAVINRAQIKPGQKVVVIGCGGVGINVIQFANFAGARVMAVDLQDDKLALAKKLGAAITVNPSTEDLRGAIKKHFGRAEVAFEVVGNPVTQQMAFDSLGPGGKMVAVGYSPKKWDGFQSGKIMFWELELIGSLGCPPRDFERILYLIETGKITLDGLITHRFKLDQINEAFEVLRGGNAVRVIIEM